VATGNAWARLRSVSLELRNVSLELRNVSFAVLSRAPLPPPLLPADQQGKLNCKLRYRFPYMVPTIRAYRVFVSDKQVGHTSRFHHEARRRGGRWLRGTPRQNELLSPELQWQSRGKTRYLTGRGANCKQLHFSSTNMSLKKLNVVTVGPASSLNIFIFYRLQVGGISQSQTDISQSKTDISQSWPGRFPWTPL
jgi:hypothetical protein